jgi:hypothetical protein
MFSSRLIRTPRIKSITTTTIFAHTTTKALFSTNSTRLLYPKDTKMSSSPPKHEMVYFPGLTSEVRAFGQFRKVVHTGLYSQLVTMEIPVGGDIGNEVHLVDQVLIFTSGTGKAVVAGKEQVCVYFFFFFFLSFFPLLLLFFFSFFFFFLSLLSLFLSSLISSFLLPAT